MAFVVEALDRGILDGAVHPLDLSIGPRMVGFGRAMFDIVPCAGILESMCSEDLSVGDRLLDEWQGRASGTGRGELDSIFGEDGVNFVGDGAD